MKQIVDIIYPHLTDEMMMRHELLTFRREGHGLYYGVYLGKMYARPLETREKIFSWVRSIERSLNLR